MRFPQQNLPSSKRKRRIIVGSCIAFLCCIIAAILLRQMYIGKELPKATLSANLVALPRQQVWKNGVSSFLFGTNDTYEWSDHNIQTEASIQDAIKKAGFTLIRSFFPDNADDKTIDTRMGTIEKSGAACLGVITNIYNTNFNKHLLTYLGKRCLIYEFGNEPDLNNISVTSYLKQWNSIIPVLRKINPDARFVGPVTYYNLGANNFMQNYLNGVKASGILPDAISYHSYPCWHDTQSACSAKATSIGQSILPVRDMVKKTLGKDLPIGITEWNYDPDNPPAIYGDDAKFITQFSKDAMQSMINANVSFACQFDAASYSGYGRLDMFDVSNNKPKAQYYAISDLISAYKL